jgi:vanillate O-demethylase monooxygenase subunit
VFANSIWYVAAWSREVTDRPFTRIICEEQILLFRDAAGQVAALSNLCPHRFAPLHLGEIIAPDRIQCPYHGLQFDATGSCVHNPHGHIPNKARLRRYPLVERHDLIWLWRGPVEEADPDLIPDFGCHADRRLHTVDGVFRVEANYELITDNLMDLSHVEFLHKEGLGSDAIKHGKHTVEQRGTTLFSNRWCPDGLAPPVWDALFGNYGKPVDHWLEMRWDPPAHLLLDVGITPAGQPRKTGISALGLNILTPETAKSTHYFWSSSRDFSQGDAAIDEMLRQAIDTAFVQQDEPMLEAVQRNMGARRFDEMKPLLLSIDAGAVRARRLLAGILRTESQPKSHGSGELRPT